MEIAESVHPAQLQVLTSTPKHLLGSTYIGHTAIHLCVDVCLQRCCTYLEANRTMGHCSRKKIGVSNN